MVVVGNVESTQKLEINSLKYPYPPQIDYYYHLSFFFQVVYNAF